MDAEKSVACVIPVGPGRQQNLELVLKHLEAQTAPPAVVVIVEDGEALPADWRPPTSAFHVHAAPKHEPGREQPRNFGVRAVQAIDDSITHVWFLDSDVIVAPNACEELLRTTVLAPEAVIACPYEWMGARDRRILPKLRNDPRWELFHQSPPGVRHWNDLSAGLACFSGNLAWPIADFERVGGFWNELHHGRCEDGELGLRAVSMQVPITFARTVRGWHLWHPVDLDQVLARNARDVPMLNDRHPWVQHNGVYLADRDGKSFEVTCPECGLTMLTNEWWEHARHHGCAIEIPVESLAWW